MTYEHGSRVHDERAGENTGVSRMKNVIISMLLTIAVLVVFWQVQSHEFVNYDDDIYVTSNEYIQGGLTLKGIIWAFSTARASNWHPMTWLSLMLDREMYGLWPGGYHWTNVMLHGVSTILLFLLLHVMTGAIWRSCFVAVLFAIHPLHVESVAWIAERKDVLSTLFWMLTLLSYVHYVKRPGLKRYLVVCLLCALGLFSKPMVVTLPCVLLLLDYWPLRRIEFGRQKRGITALHLLIEKIPLLGMSAGISVATLLAQKSGNSVMPFDTLSLAVRVANALVSYVRYIGKALWPSDLAVLYPHPGMWPLWIVIISATLLFVITAVFIRAAERYPYGIVGWLWYLGTLVPVIGIIQVGSQAMADRYTYIPLTGIFVIIVWGMHDILRKWPAARTAVTGCGVLIIAILMIVSRTQVGYWKSGIELFGHTTEITQNNHVAHNNYGNALARKGMKKRAEKEYRTAIRIRPSYAQAYNNLGNVLKMEGQYDKAVEEYNRALSIRPEYIEALFNMGSLLMARGRYEEAIDYYSKVLTIKPDHAAAFNNIGIVNVKRGKLEEAIANFRSALSINPEYRVAENNLQLALKDNRKITKKEK